MSHLLSEVGIELCSLRVTHLCSLLLPVSKALAIMGWGCLSGQKHRLFLEKLFVNMRPLEAQLPSFLFASTVLNGQAVELIQKAMASY